MSKERMEGTTHLRGRNVGKELTQPLQWKKQRWEVHQEAVGMGAKRGESLKSRERSKMVKGVRWSS